MPYTYYEVTNDEGKPATVRQQRLLGRAGYGYKNRVVAELNCPNGCAVNERHCDNSNDWSGRVVSYRLSTGELVHCA